MRIAVMAAGAVGGYFGARLAAAGHDVVFFARGANLEAIRRDGLKIGSVHGNLHLKDVNVTDDPSKVAPVDIVLFAVKLWDTERAAESLKPLLGPKTRVITLQNGIDSVERLQPILGTDHVVGGIAYIASVITSPGVISHTSAFASIRCGRVDGKPDPELQAFAAAAKTAAIDIAVSDAIEVERWKKFVFLVGMSATTSATRMPMGPIMADPDTRELLSDVVREVIAVAHAKGVALPDNFIEEGLRLSAAAPATMRASMAHDLERGNRLELDWLSGKVVELGRVLHVPTPANKAIYASLKLHRMGRP
jgi:2-dehydropantoate 2-reductase